jgi:Flp pilus assembly protein protease CpaA
MTVSVAWPQIVFAACVGTFTIAAAVWDVRERRIPNWLNLAALTGAVFWQMATHGWTGLGDAAAGFSAGLLHGSLEVMALVTQKCLVP